MRSRSLWTSFGHAFAGLAHVLRTQRNARIHVAIAILVVAVGCVVGLSLVEWAVLATVIGLVLAAEVVNTTVEAVVDLLSPEYHDRARVAKDTAAAAVLVVSLAAVVVGLLILGPPLLRWLQTIV